MKEKFYIIYKTTNIKNSKFYIGAHETFILEDGYLGSGKILKRSIKYYGLLNFKREILEYCNNANDMYNREAEIVNKELLNNKLCMNIIIGGRCGLTPDLIANGHKRQRWLLKNDKDWRKKRSAKASKSLKGRPGTFINKKHSKETIQKMCLIRGGTGTGKSNSQYGSRWITNGIKNSKIKKDCIVPEGWKFGRT